MAPPTTFRVAKVLAVATTFLSHTAQAQQTQAAVSVLGGTFTAVLSFGDVILIDASHSVTIDPGQYTTFDYVTVSAVPERTAIVLVDTESPGQTFGFTAPPRNSPGAASTALPSQFGGSLSSVIVTGPSSGSHSGQSFVVSGLPGSSYLIDGFTTSKTIGEGEVATVNGQSVSAFATGGGVVVDGDMTLTIALPTATPGSTAGGGVGGSVTMSTTARTTSKADTTLVTGTHSPTFSSTAAQQSTGMSSSASAAGTSSSSTGAAAGLGDVVQGGFVGWLAAVIGMFVFTLGL